MQKSYDVVIVGGGVAGALLAWRLSGKGLSILVLEAGDDRTAERVEMSLAYAYSLVKSPGSPYNKNPRSNLPFPDSTKPGKADYYRYQDKSSEFKSTYVKIGGGSTWHFLGNVPRFLPNDFQLKKLYGVGEDWPIDYEDLRPYYRLAEEQMGVSGNSEQWRDLYAEKEDYSFPMPEIWPTYSDSVLKTKLDSLQIDGHTILVRSTPQARNSQTYQGRPACAGNSSCVPICPIAAKYDASVHLNLCKERGVDVAYQSVVFHLEAAEKGQLTHIHFKNWEGVESKVGASVVVVAAHAIESALLLQYSGLANSSGQVGRNLMDHPQGYGVGLSSDPLFPFRGPPTTSGIDVFRDGPFRMQHGAFRISLGNDGWGRWKGEDKLEKILNELTDVDKTFLIGEELKARLRETGTRLFRFSFSTEMLPDPENKVVPHPNDRDPVTGLPLPQLNFKIDRQNSYSQNAFAYASRVLETMLRQIGEPKPETISRIDDFSGAGHIMGTTRMGSEKEKAVVDKNCQTFDHPNLFLVGAGVFPTCGTANPTLTVAALALRLAAYLEDQFTNKAFGA